MTSSESGSVRPIVSGVAYTVVEVDGRPCASLDEFAAETSFTIEQQDGPYTVGGVGVRQDDDQGPAVRFHEKDPVLGKDLRVWRIAPGEAASGEATFTACHVGVW